MGKFEEDVDLYGIRVSDSCKACCRIPLVSPQSVILSFGDQFGVRGTYSHIVAGGRRPTAGDCLIQLRTCIPKLLVDIVNSGSTRWFISSSHNL